jgi:hypothetical protein
MSKREPSPMALMFAGLKEAKEREDDSAPPSPVARIVPEPIPEPPPPVEKERAAPASMAVTPPPPPPALSTARALKPAKKPRAIEPPPSIEEDESDDAEVLQTRWYGTIEKEYVRQRDDKATRKRGFVLTIELIANLERFCAYPKRSANVVVEEAIWEYLGRQNGGEVK